MSSFGPLGQVVEAVTDDRSWLRVRAKVVRPALRTVSLEPRRPVRGNVLLSWMTEAFTLIGGSLPNTHANLWECRQVARTFLDLGFHVDVINYRNVLFTPRTSYDFFIDNRVNMERLAPALGDGCTKIAHLETSHMLFQNAAEYQRLLDLQQRRGVTLAPRRVERRVNHAIEHADLAVLYGNEQSASTWAYAGKSMYPVPAAPLRRFPSPATRDVAANRHRFLWLGSHGAVLKGLDLVLEAFAGMPELQLTVCGPVEDEADFAEAFHRELHETPNITTLGWVDIHGSRFRQLVQDTVGFVYPSASESQSGAVITCLQAGLIPIISRECDVPVDDSMGVVLHETSVEAIRTAVRAIADQPASHLSRMAEDSWGYSRSVHSQARFASAYRDIVRGLLGEQPMPASLSPSPRQST